MSEHGSEGEGVMSTFKGENGILNLMLVVALVGSVASQYAPGLLAPISGIIGKPLDSILYVYTLTFFMYTMIGEEKDASEIMKKMMPILMVVIVAGSFFNTGVDTTKYLMLIIAAPLLGKAARNLINGGAFKLIGKRFDKKKHPHWKNFFEELSKGEKGHDEGKDKDRMTWFFHNSPRIIGELYDNLRLLKGEVRDFNDKKSKFEGSVKAFARISMVHVAGGSASLMLPSTTTKAQFDAVKFKKTLGGDMSFEEIVKALEANVHSILSATHGAPPLSGVLLIDPALAAALHIPAPGTLIELKADIDAKKTALEAVFDPVKISIDNLKSSQLVSGMLTMKSEDIKEEIDSTNELLGETRKLMGEVKAILEKVA